MKDFSSPLAWEQYSSNSEEEDDLKEQKELVDAKEKIFLRKFSNFPLNKEELIQIFNQEKYDDEKILIALNDKLNEINREKIINDIKSKTNNNNKLFNNNNNIYKNYNNNNNYYYHKNYYKYNNHHKNNKKFRNKKNYKKTRLVEINDNYINNECNQDKIENLELNKNINDDINSNEEYDQITTTGTNSKGMDILSNISSNEFNNINQSYDMKFEENKFSYHNNNNDLSLAKYCSAENFEHSHNYIKKKYDSELIGSKLFPGAFIYESKNFLHKSDYLKNDLDEKPDKFKNGLFWACEYYSSMLKNTE
jgi:hypothetical protein